MEKKFDTVFGELTVRGAMLDVNGTDLCDGVEFKIDGELVGETTSVTFSEVKDMNDNEIEELVETHCDGV